MTWVISSPKESVLAVTNLGCQSGEGTDAAGRQYLPRSGGKRVKERALPDTGMAQEAYSDGLRSSQKPCQATTITVQWSERFRCMGLDRGPRLVLEPTN